MKKLWSVGFVLGSVFAVGLFSLIGRVIAATYTSQDVNYPIYIDNSIFTPNTPAQNVEGSTYLPLRAMSEALGVQIEWDANERRVDVYKNLTPETRDVPDVFLWDYISDRTNDIFLIQQSSATIMNLSDDNDEYAIKALYYTKKTDDESAELLEGTLNVNFTKGTFELIHIKDGEASNFKGSIDNNFNVTNIKKDSGSETDCKAYVKEKLDEYKNDILYDKYDLKLIGLKPSEMKNKKIIEYVK